MGRTRPTDLSASRLSFPGGPFSQYYWAVSLQAMGKEVDAARPWILKLEAQNTPSNPRVQLQKAAAVFRTFSCALSLGLSSH